MGEQVGTKLFIAIASVFIVLVVALVVVAVVKGNEELKALKNAGDNSNSGFFNRVSEGLDGDDSEEIIINNVPRPLGVPDPGADDDGDDVPNSEDIDVDGDGELNSEEGMVILKCGDSNGDDVLDQTDLDAIISYTFEGKAIPEGVNVDLDGNGVLDIIDVVLMVDHVKRGEPEPTCASDSALKSYEDSICGDSNGDSVLDQADLDAITSYAFQGVEIPVGVKADLNGDGVVDIIDVSLMTNHVRRGAAAPTCGVVNNLPPVINSFVGPSYAMSQAINSWNLTANDPEGKPMIYQVNFGDGTNTSIFYNVSSGFMKSFSHQYIGNGNFTVGVKVSDENGLDAGLTRYVEVLKGNIFFCDFWSNNSIGVSVGGERILARDKNGVLIGISNSITVDGLFLLHTYGDDPFTQGNDEGPVSGENVSFYKSDESCVLLNGNNKWVDRGDKQITLDCS